jgi:beta-galactosidase
MWHVDNEYASAVTECFCDESAAAFREWLKERYSTIERLNEVWGTAFWSQLYSDWDEIHPPRKAPASVNPTQQLNWKRFNSDSWIACFDEQKTIINKFTPNLPVTTNFMGFHKPADYWKFASHEDIVSNDNYPDMFDPKWMIEAAMICDLMRSLGNRQPWILMEQATSNVNWRQRNATKRPGMMRLCSYQAIARGADGVMFFQWRASIAGSEKHHSAMLPHIGTDSRVWQEVKSFGNELSKLDSILASQVKAKVAIILDWENWWALELDGKPSNDLRLMKQIMSYYMPLYQRNITVEFVHPESDLSHYKLVIAPNLYLVNDASARNINQYVKNGGSLVMSFFSGIVDENEHIRVGGYPAPFCEMLGLVIEEFTPYSETQANSICTSDDKQFQCTFWGDVIHLKGANALAIFEQDYYKESAAVTHNRYGKGDAFYVGTVLEETGMEWLLELVCKTAEIESVNAHAPAGVEILHRENGKSSWIFILNHSNECKSVPMEKHGYNLLTGEKTNDLFTLDPTDVAIIQLDE